MQTSCGRLQRSSLAKCDEKIAKIHRPYPLSTLTARLNQKTRSKRRKSCACDDGCREIAGGNEDDRLARSSSSEQQCACMASSACESEADSSPVGCQRSSYLPKDHPHLFFGPRSVSGSGHLTSTKASRVGALGTHLRERGKNLGLVVKHREKDCWIGCCVYIWSSVSEVVRWQ
jgi:hypothetical protein